MYKIVLDKQAIEDLLYYSQSNPKNLVKIVKLIESISKTPFEGIGKPEPLKHNFSGYWSRRISDVNRIIYKVDNETIKIASLKGHYDD